MLADSWLAPRSPAALVAALERAGVEVTTERAPSASPSLVYAAWGGEADAAELVLVLDGPPPGGGPSPLSLIHI